MLNEDIMPLCQYYAYIEILDEREELDAPPSIAGPKDARRLTVSYASTRSGKVQ